MKPTRLIAVLLSLLSGGAVAQDIGQLVDEDGYYLFLVLPDPVFIEQECSRWSNADANEALVAQARDICRRVRAGDITPDEFVVELRPVREKIYTDAQRSVSCGNCVLVGIERQAPVPDGYATYATALITSEETRRDYDWLREFYRSFLSFGESITEEHAAIWLGIDGLNPSVERGKAFADRFDLDYNAGPFIVVTDARPDLLEPGDEILFLRFGGIDQARIIRLMNSLEQEIRRGGEIDTRGLVFQEVRQRLYSSAARFDDKVAILFETVLK